MNGGGVGAGGDGDFSGFLDGFEGWGELGGGQVCSGVAQRNRAAPCCVQLTASGLRGENYYRTRVSLLVGGGRPFSRSVVESGVALATE